MNNLRECPFCGEKEAEYTQDKDDYGDTSRYVRCGYCGSRGEECATREQAETAWNQRHTDKAGQ